MNNNQIKILVVDDRPNNLRLLSNILTEEGYKVQRAISGQLALNAAIAHTPDLILLDIMMPEMNGYEVCTRLKANSITRNIPVIFSSAIKETSEKVKAFEVGGADYITKPFKLEEVLARVKNQLTIQKLSKQLQEQNTKLQQEIENRKQAEAEIRKLNAELEQRVKERTRTLEITNQELEREIIENKLLEQKLRSTEAEMRAFFEAMTDIVIILDEGANNIKVAPTRAARSGKFSADIVALTVEQFFMPPQAETFLSQIKRAIEAQQTVNFEYSLFLEEEEIWFAASISPILKDSVIWAARDITYRVRAESALQQLASELEERVSARTAQLQEANHILLQEIRDRTAAESALRESERRFRAIFNNTFQFTALLTPDGTILEANQASLDFTGTKHDDVMGLPFWEIRAWTISRETQEQLKIAIATAASGEFVRYEVDIRSAGDTVATVDFSLKPLLNETGKTLLLIAEGRNITERKQTEEALKQQKELLQTIFDHIPVMVCFYNRAGKIQWCNREVERVLGWSIAELKEYDMLSECYPDAEYRQKVLDFMLSPMGKWQDFKTRTRSSYIQDTSWSNIRLSDDKIIGIGQDITDRKQAELALRESEARFRGIFESAAIAISLINGDGRFIEVNPTFEVFFGYSEAEIHLRHFTDITHPDDAAADVALNQAVIAGMRDSYQLEKRYIRKDGQLFWGRLTVSAVRDRSGRFEFTVAIIEDINEVKEREFALRVSERRFRAIFNNSFQFTGVLKPDGTVIEVNQTALNFGGIEHGDVAGLPFWETCWWHEETAIAQDNDTSFLTAKQKQLKVAIEEAASGRFVRYEADIRGYGDVALTIDFSIKPIVDETGKIVLLIPEGRDISDRKQAEQRLQLLERAIAAANNGVIVSDAQVPDNPIIYVNSGFERMTGYQKEEVIGNRCCPVEPSSTAPTILEELRCAIANGKETQITLRSYRKDGSLFWSELCITPVRDATGRLTNFIGVQTDISDRKAIEIALQQSQDRFQKLAANVPGIIYEFVLHSDGSASFPYASSACREIFEIEPLAIKENALLAFEDVHPDDLERLYDSITRSAQTLQPWELEWRLFGHRSRKLKWLQGIARPEKLDNGDIIWQGVVIDISDRKQAEIEIAVAKAALERQIQRVLLLEKITQQIRSSLNPEQIFQTAATQIGQALRVDRCLIHAYIDNQIPQLPFVADYKEPGVESILSIEVPVIGNPHIQALLTQDSAIASDNVCTDPLLEAASYLCQQLGLKSMLAVRTSYQGKPNGVIGLHQYDRFRHWTEEEIELLELVAAQVGIAIAQAKLLEQETQQRQELAAQNHALEKAKLEAEAANRAKSLFLSKMSHELRTPLNAILGFTQVMDRDNSLTKQHKEHLEIINRSGEHLLQLINDILSMSKIEAGQVTLNENRFNLHKLLASIEEMLRLKASSKGLKFIIELSPDLPQYVETDESKLRQVLINLLGNAIKFTSKGSVILRAKLVDSSRLTVSSEQSTVNSQQLLFEVEDTGSGIAADELPTIFNPFVQTQTGRQSMEGTGLGLTISRQFVRIMGGEIAVSSQLGKGATFTFDIQVGLATGTDEKKIASRRRVIGLAADRPTYRILIVEDILENRQLLLQLLEPLGFEVREAVNGEEAIALWESWSPHLILMDILMPIVDGYEATQQIKAKEWEKLRAFEAGREEQQNVQRDNSSYTSPASRVLDRQTIIIALTASAFEEQREGILRAGCDDFLPKPFQEGELLEKMATYLGVRYIYEEEKQLTSTQSTAHSKLTTEDLSVMPGEWVAQLHQAALCVDDRLSLELIQQLPETQEQLKNALIDLVNNFRMDTIIELTQFCME